jgi:CBS domain protein
MAIISAKRVANLPVISDGELLGIVSIGDLSSSIVSRARASLISAS